MQPIIVVEILQKILGILNIHVHNSCFLRLISTVLFIVFCFSMHRYYKRPICIQFNAATTAKLFYIASYLKLYEINILQTNKACHQRLKRSNSRFFFNSAKLSRQCNIKTLRFDSRTDVFKFEFLFSYQAVQDSLLYNAKY